MRYAFATLVLATCSALAGCGEPGGPSAPPANPPLPTFVATSAPDLMGRPGRTPSQVAVSQRQVDAARLLGVPAAFQSPGAGTFVFIPGGSFTMGSPESEAGRDPSEVQHLVHVDRGFYLQTQPDSAGFTLALGQASMNRAAALRLAKGYSDLDPVHDYRLPTEAEWEYACRAGSETRWWWGAAVRGEEVPYAANPWGLLHMGGFPEWCLDGYGDLPSWEVSDPHGPQGEGAFVVRGHLSAFAKSVNPILSRSAARFAWPPDKKAWVRLVAPLGYGLGAYGSVKITFRLTNREGETAPNKDYSLRVISMNDRLAARTTLTDAEWTLVKKPALPITLTMVPGAYYVYVEGRRDGVFVRGIEKKFYVKVGEDLDLPVPVPDGDLSRFGSGAHEGPK